MKINCLCKKRSGTGIIVHIKGECEEWQIKKDEFDQYETIGEKIKKLKDGGKE